MTGLPSDFGRPIRTRPLVALPSRFRTPLVIWESITCPTCGWTSFNPHDVREGWCGNCRESLCYLPLPMCTEDFGQHGAVLTADDPGFDPAVLGATLNEHQWGHCERCRAPFMWSVPFQEWLPTNPDAAANAVRRGGR